MVSCLQAIETAFMVTVPCDSPFVPKDLVKRLHLQLLEDDADTSVAHSGKRLQPVFTLMKTSLKDSMRDYLNSGERKIDKWFEQHKLAITDFSDQPDTFININTQEELSSIESKITNSIQ